MDGFSYIRAIRVAIAVRTRIFRLDELREILSDGTSHSIGTPNRVAKWTEVRVRAFVAGLCGDYGI